MIDYDDIEKSMMHPNVLGAGAKARKHLKPHQKFEAVLKEYERHTLHSGSGALVKKRSQALAIAFSEERKAKRRHKHG